VGWKEVCTSPQRRKKQHWGGGRKTGGRGVYDDPSDVPKNTRSILRIGDSDLMAGILQTMNAAMVVKEGRLR